MKTLKTLFVMLAFWGLSLSVAHAETFMITSFGSGYSVSANLFASYSTLQSAINFIKTRANGADCTILFGNGSTALNIGGGSTTLITFDGSGSPKWGKITLTGKITTSNTAANGVIRLENGVSINSSADITGTGTGMLIYNNSTGTITISGGTVQTTTGVAILNNSTGPLEISGGTVKATGTGGRAIYNISTGAVNISGSAQISSTTDITVDNANAGRITISGNANITSANTNNEYSTIFLNGNGTSINQRLVLNGGTVSNTAAGGNAIRNNSVGRITTNGGTVQSTTGVAIWNNSTARLEIGNSTVKATGAGGRAIYNVSTGDVNISGSQISSTTGITIDNANAGIIAISGNANITSANTNNAYGTIFLYSNVTSTLDRLVINGGTVSNTANNGIAIRNNSVGRISISGGTVQATTGAAIRNNSTAILNISNGTVRATGTGGRAIHNISTGEVNISGTSQISSTTGITIDNANAGKITISGNANVTSANTDSGYGTILLYNDGTSPGDRLVINGGTISNTATSGNAIRNNSVGAVSISGGTVQATTGEAIRNNSTGALKISGGIATSAGDAISNRSTGIVTISGTAQVSTTTTGAQSAIYNSSTGAININGGTVSGGSSYAVFNNSTGVVTISGGTVQTATGVAVRNYSTGELKISGGTVRATGAAGRAIYNNSTGAVNISGSAQISSTTGITIDNANTGKITVSNNATITSANTNNTYGTIFLNNAGAATGDRLVINGGTISNTATGGNTIINNSVGSVSISGGTVQANGGYAIRNSSTGKVNINGGIIFAYGKAITDVINGSYTTNYKEFQVKKVDGEGKLLSGAVLTLAPNENYPQDPSVITYDRTTVGGYADFSATPGEYILSEKQAPTGYNATDDKHYITITDDGVFLNVNSLHMKYEQVTFVNKKITELNKDDHNVFMEGYDGMFRPNDPVTRAEFATLAAHFDNLSLTDENNFPDVPNDHWAVKYINSAITSGNGVIAAWDNSAGKTNYFIGSSTDIFKFPATAAALWENIGGKGGISISHGGTTGFIPLNVTVGVNTGISETKTESVQVYPNPTSDVLNFSIETTYEIIDLQGRVLQKSELAVNSINISSLPAGIYFVILKTDTGKTVKKIMKK